jgi:hypothetical protein
MLTRMSCSTPPTMRVRAVSKCPAPLADPFLAIVNEENTRLTSDDDSGQGHNARLSFRPENSGDYLIQASGFGGSTGDYEIKIVRR